MTKHALSALSLAPMTAAGTVAAAFENVVNMAQLIESLGFERLWIAEHHNLPGITSSATDVLIGHIAGKTQKIHVGSGGIMLPNHAPLIVAERFGTLESLYPGRIELGLGRAPGTDPWTSRALRRDLKSNGDDFPELVEEVQAFLAPAVEGQRIRAIPGAGLDIPIWILGSSLFSAQMSAQMGLPYTFAGHFAPASMIEAFELYRRHFQASDTLEKPKSMACVPVIVAPTDAEAIFLASTLKQRISGIVTGNRNPLPSPPKENVEANWSAAESAMVRQFLAELIVGSPETVRKGLQSVLQRTKADQIMVSTDLYSFADTKRSFELLTEVWGSM